MGSTGLFPLKFTRVLTFLLCSSLSTTAMVKPENQEGCSATVIEGFELEKCLHQSSNMNSITSMDSCCLALNQALQAGFHCLCFLLATATSSSSSSSSSSSTTTSLFSTPLFSPLSTNCYISAPPLSHCQALMKVLQPPVSPASTPSELQQTQNEVQPPSAPNPMLVPPPTQKVEATRNSTPDKNSAIVPANKPPFLNSDFAPNLSVSKTGCFMSNGHGFSNLLLLSKLHPALIFLLV